MPLTPRLTLLLAPVALIGSLLAPTASSAVTTSHGHQDVGIESSFTVATFNVLGHRHTVAGADKADEYAGSRLRTRWAIQALNNQGVEVVGLQEFEEEQKRVFLNNAGDEWEVWSGSNRPANSLAWRKDSFEFVEGETILIPYFNGTLRPMPIALLRNKASGQEMYFTTFHLPASSRGRDSQHWRNVGIEQHIELAHELRNRNVPVFFTGDMNEKEEYFCKFSANGDMHAANGGSNVDGVCRPPQRPNRSRIDWLFASYGAQFSNYRADDSALVNKITDHALVVADVS